MASNSDPNKKTGSRTRAAGESASEGSAPRISETEERRSSASRSRTGASRSAVARRRRKRRRANRKGRWLFWFIPLILLLGAGAYYFFQNYLLIGGHVYPRDLSVMDLRGTSVSVDTYEEVRRSLPDTQIYWDVPLSGGSFDAGSESIAISDFSEDDLALLHYFTDLRSVDATAARLSVEEYSLLRETLPGADIRWSIPVGGERYPSDSQSITLEYLDAEDLDNFAYFVDLRQVDARACRNYEAIMALREVLPDAEITWQVPLSGTEYLADAEEILVDDPALTVAELEEALRYLPAVRSVDAQSNGWTSEEKAALLAAWPEISFRWPVTICGTEYNGDETRIDLSGRKLSATDVEELVQFIPSIPTLETLELTGTGVSLEDALRIHEVAPEAALVFDFTLYGVEINTQDEFIDFTRIAVDSVESVEAVIPLMPNLTRIDMSYTGIDFEVLDQMNKRHDDVRVVWTMLMGDYYEVRTDDIGFRATARHYGTFPNNCFQWFKYCEDMICLDLGHRQQVTDLSFLYGTPHVKYLILLDNRAQDLTPIASLKELVWLEMNRASAPSIAPLADNESIRDMNITFMDYLKPDVTFETLMNMPNLERVWFSSPMLSQAQEEQLKAAHPDTVYHRVYTWVQSNQNPWRFDKDYYDMRDLLNLFYQNESGRIYYRIIDGVRYDLDPAFAAAQGTAEFDRDRTVLHQVYTLPEGWGE